MIQESFYVQQPERLTSENIDALLGLTGKYSCNIQFSCHEQHANAKSMIGVLMMRIHQGTYLTLIADGEDEYEAAQALMQFFHVSRTPPVTTEYES